MCTGQPVISSDPAAVQAGGRSPLCPVIAPDATAAHHRELSPSGRPRLRETLHECGIPDSASPTSDIACSTICR